MDDEQTKNDVKSGHATQSKSNITYAWMTNQIKVDVKSGHDPIGNLT